MAITIKNDVMKQYKDALALDRQREQALFKAEQTRQAIDTPKAKVSDWQVAGETVADILGNVVVGAQKGLEGIYDFGATLVGAVGGIFDKDFQKDVQEHVAYNWTEDTTGKALREATQNSAVYNLSDKGQAIVRGVSQGVGQMLPTVAITAISGGAGLGVKAAQTVGMLSLGASAAGTSTEEAFNEGASYLGGAAYGVLNGALEMATEKLVGGAWDSVLGKGIADSAIKKVVSGATQNKVLQKGLKVLIDSAGEGAEEMVSEIVSPYLKRLTYDQQADTATVESVVEAGLIGALTSLAYGGAQTAVKKVAGINTVIPSELENVATYDEALKKGWDSNDKAAVERVSQAKAETLKTISQELANMSEDKRAKYIEKHNLGGMFNADGTLTDTYNNDYNGNMELARAYDTRYVSMGADVNAINSDMQVLTDNMVKDYAQKNNVSIEQATAESKPIQVYQGELTDKAQESVAKAKKFTSKMSEIGLSNLNLVVVDENPMFNGVVVNGKNIYVGKDTFENGNWTKTIIHEVLHTNEDTETYKILADTVRKIAEGKGILNARQQEILERYQGSDQKTIDSELTALLTEELIGNEQFIDKVVAEQPNIAMRFVKKIQNLIKLFKMSGEKRAEYKVLTLAENMYLRSAYDHGRQNLIQIIEQGREDNKQVQVDEQNAEVGVDQTLALQYEDSASAYEYEQTMKYSLVEDKKTLDFLNEQKHIKVYRAMQVIDGKLYPPMAAKIKGDDGKTTFVEATQLGKWYQADEHPELVTNGKFTLNKGNGSSITAAYNPYWHTSKSPLNDQFTSAYKRDNLVTVECEVPESELTSGYKAEGAKDSVGEMSWHSGQVSSKLSGEKTRKVILSRWVKVNRIVPDSEVASKIAKLLEGENVSIPDNTITPSLRSELEKLGVEIMRSGKVDDSRYSLKDSQGNELSQQQAEYFRDSKVRDEQGNLLVVYHGSKANATVFKKEYISSWNMFGRGYYFTSSKKRAERFAKGSLKKVYLNIENPFFTNKRECLDLLYAEINNTQKDIEEYSEEKGVGGREFFKICYYLDDIGVDVSKILQDLGFDGVYDEGYEDIEVVAYESKQIKLTTNLNPTSDQDIRYSIKPFAEQVDDILGGKDTSSTHLKIMDTPQILQDVGLPKLPILMTARHLDTTVNESGKKGLNYHGLGIDIIKQLPKLIEKPALIAESLTRDDSVVLITQAVDKKNKPIIVAIKVNGIGRLENIIIQANVMTSAYGKDNFYSYIKKFIDNDKILFWDKKRSQRVSVNPGLQLSDVITNLASNTIIRKIAIKSQDFVSKNPNNIKLSRKSPAPSKVGDIIKAKGNLTTDKIFTKEEAKKIIADIEESLVFEEKGMVGTIKDTNELIDQLWKGLNKAKKGEYIGVGVKIADFVINHTVVEDIYEALSGDVEVEEARQVIKTLKQYFHKVKISDRVLGEIKHHFDDKVGKVLALWRAKEGGLAPDQIAQEIEKTGYITSDNESQIFIEMVEAYNKAVETVNRKSEIALNSVLDSEEIYQLRQNIISAVLDGKNAYGKDSTLTKLKQQVNKEKQNYRTAAKKIYERNYAANHALYKVQQIIDLKNHRFVNSATPKADIFKALQSLLGKIKHAGNLNESGTRKTIKKLNEWYTPDNEMLGYVEGSNVGATLFDPQLKADIESIANGEERMRLTVEEIRLLDKILTRLYTLMVNDSRIFRAGRWVDAKSKAQQYYEIDKANQEIKKSNRFAKFWNLVNKKFGNFRDMILDPASVVRYHDAYNEKGFWTECYEDLRKAGQDTAIMEMNFKEPIDKFLEQHKGFLNETAKREIDYRGQKIVVQNAIHLYMYFKRQLAQAGLVRNGFVVYDKDGNKTIYKRIKETTDLNEIGELAKAEEQALYKQFTQAEKEYIKILEKIFNEDCKKAKEKTDIIRMGGSNVSDGYYVPITRYGAKQEQVGNIIYDELDSLSNASFNKNTVQNSHMLNVGSIHDVCLKHIREVSRYANTQIVIDNYKKLYNVDLSQYINGEENINSGMRLGDMLEWQTNGKRSGGHEYFNKLILDMVGIKQKPDAFNKAIGWIRGNTAIGVLALNPKVILTQLSSYIASGHILSVNSLVRGAMLSGKDVDAYSNLAKLRNYDGTAYLAQTLTNDISGKYANLKEKLMTFISKTDRFVIERLFASCQVEIEKTQGLKLGSEENKIEAGKLLDKIILETQQNTIMTEKSALMRSTSELGKSLVMFTSDMMKNTGRMIDSFGKHFVLKKRLANAQTDTERAAIKAEIKANNKQIVKSLVTMTSLATYGSLIAMLFSHIFGTNDEDETLGEEFMGEFMSTWVAGIPILKDIYNFFNNGYEMQDFTLGSINDVLGGITDFANGVEKYNETGETRQLLSGTRKLAFSSATALGLPLKNLYKMTYGGINIFSPSTAYKIDDTFYKQPYSKDLAKAIAKDDDIMISTITELMLQDKSGGNFSDGTREEINRLVYQLGDTSFLPKSVNQTFSFNKEQYTLTSKEFKQAKADYKKANQKIDDLIAKSGYKTATDEEKAAMIKFVYDYYYEQTIVEAIGADKSKTLLFASGIKLEDMAIIVGMAKVIEADKDRNGNTIAGSKKKKIVAMLERQRLTADQKYLMLAYLGYSTDMERVERYVNRLRLTRDEKKALLEECA